MSGQARADEVVRRWQRDAQCVGLARAELRKALAGWGLGALEDDALIIASELVTNAVRHAFGPTDREIETRYVRLAHGVRVEVHDACPARPVPVTADTDEGGGRGLWLVAALADRWAVGERSGPGKRVWAEMSVKGMSL
ncbi:ATP-binding protein [Streptomyces bambusae]|uniref:ATP-binding protein n=1 Tax=Streptomyces bambusae TaxID=1550616 RepID=UPI0027E21040|nr:ATP-binding protein [Streptomyces bambusae]